MLFLKSMALTRPSKNKIRTLIYFNKSHNNVGLPFERENSNWYTKIINTSRAGLRYICTSILA